MVRGPPRTGEGSGPRGGQEADASGHEETRVETHRRDFSGQVLGLRGGSRRSVFWPNVHRGSRGAVQRSSPGPWAGAAFVQSVG